MENKIVKQEPNPIALINMAMEKGLDIEKLSKLFDLQERWEKRESEKAFYDAFANFQRKCPKIKKLKNVKYQLKEGGYVNYNYAPLSEIVEQIKEPLATNGLSYRFEFVEVDKLITCTCIVSHSGGYFRETKMSGFKDDSGKKNLIQQAASTHTYLQRYTLIGALGISSAEDDIDGRQKITKENAKTKEEQLVILAKWKKQFDSLKTPTEIKLNSENYLKEAEKEGCLMEELKNYVHYIYQKLKKEVVKNNSKEVKDDKLKFDMP
jgi:hypothetical protein